MRRKTDKAREKLENKGEARRKTRDERNRKETEPEAGWRCREKIRQRVR